MTEFTKDDLRTIAAEAVTRAEALAWLSGDQ